MLADGALEQVGPAHVSYKYEVSGESADRIIAPLEIRNEEGQVLRSMSGCVNGAQANLSERDHRPVAQARCRCERVFRVTPVATSFRGEVECRTRRVGQGSGTGDEIGVYMRLRDVSDTHPFCARRAGVLCDVEVRIDDDCFAGLLAGNHVARLRQIFVVEAFEEHRLVGTAVSVAGRADSC